MQTHLSTCDACTGALKALQGLAGPGAPLAFPAEITRTLPQGFEADPPVGPLPQVQHIGPYILLEQLGSGAVGSVYAAYHPQLDRQVAVKLLHSQQGERVADTQAPERLLREAQALARLSHPNVVAVHDAGTWEGRVFMVMEQVPGMDLRAWLKEKPRTWREVRDVFVQAGEGLAAAHAAGLVHRDFKPPNVLVGKDGRIRVADFGLARAAHGAEARSEETPLTPGGGVRLETTLTQAGFAVGTLAYMAPEQLRGLPADARTDQFAFCVSLWEALYGKRPWAETILGRDRGPRMEPADTRDTPPFFRALLDRGLAEEPSLRFPSMDVLLEALREDLETKRRRRNGVIACGAAVLVVFSLGTWGVVRQRDAATRVCERPISAFAGLWDDAAKGRLRSAFAATQVTSASDIFGRVDKALDQYVDEWAQVDRRLCEDTLVHRSQSEETRRQQSACLERRRGEVEALVTLLGQVDAKMLNRAVGATAGLSTPKACADTKRLAHEPPGPVHVRNTQAVVDWRKELQRGYAQIFLGQYPESEATAQDVVAKARAAQEPGQVGAGLFLAGLVKSRMGLDDEAIELTKQAFSAALEGRDDVVAFRGANLTAYSLAFLGNRVDEAMEWFATAEALLERLGTTPDLSYALANTRSVLFTGSKGEDSIKLADEAVQVAKVAFGEDALQTQVAVANLASAYFDEGRFEEAVVVGRNVTTLFESILGPSNPMLVPALVNLGNALGAVGQLDEALVVHQRAQGLALAAFGEGSHHTLGQPVNVSMLLRKLGRSDEAYPMLVKAMEATRSTMGSTPLFGTALAQRGWLELARGNVKAARRTWEETRMHFAQEGEGKEALQREFEDGLAQLELDAGRPEVAVPLLEKALILREKSHSAVDDIAVTRFALARALSTTALSKTRAIELLEKVEQELKGVSFRQRELEQVRALHTQLTRPP
jgi:eukaryotic-like serine/threonine-protein kinase